MCSANPQPPQPTTRLFAEPLRLSPKQRRVLEALQQHQNGARVVDIAKQLNMHINTARGHLDELINHGAVRAVSSHTHRRGRPSLIFQVRVPDNRAIAQEYNSLVTLLIELLGDPENPTEHALEQARELGAKWAKNMNTSGNEAWQTEHQAVTAALCILHELGFDPSVKTEGDQTTNIAPNNDPFINEQPRGPKLICAIHQGFISEISDSARIHLACSPLNKPGKCTTNLEADK